MLAVRWYLRFGLSDRDVEELVAGRGIEVDHVTVFRWVHIGLVHVPRAGGGTCTGLSTPPPLHTAPDWSKRCRALKF
jgi:hypothetical protein